MKKKIILLFAALTLFCSSSVWSGEGTGHHSRVIQIIGLKRPNSRIVITNESGRKTLIPVRRICYIVLKSHEYVAMEDIERIQVTSSGNLATIIKRNGESHPVEEIEGFIIN